MLTFFVITGQIYSEEIGVLNFHFKGTCMPIRLYGNYINDGLERRPKENKYRPRENGKFY